MIKNKGSMLLLAAVLMLSLMSTQVLAAPVHNEIFTEQRCGDDAFWRFEDGTLTIYGTGPMYDYRVLVNDQDVFYDRPWQELEPEIRHIVVEEGITSLGSDSFPNLPNLVSVSLPSSLQSIGNFAFWNCRALERVVLSEGLVSIGQQAFWFCGLKSVEIPASVTFVDANAFEDCRSLTDVLFRSDPDIPGFVMGNSVFRNCTSLEEIRVEEDHLALRSIDGALYFDFGDGSKSLNSYPAGRTNKELRIPENTVFISQNAAYSNPYLETVIFPSSVQSIDNMAFGNCRRLNTLVFEGSVPNIDYNVFWSCNATLRYPCGDEAWTEAQNTWDTEAIFGWQGSVTWEAYHVAFEENVLAPTCTQQGYTTHTCTGCGHSYVDSYVDPTGHSFGDWVVLQKPSNGESGLRERTCATCGHTETEVIPWCYGDANGDEEVNGKDLILLRQYLAGWNVTLEMVSADCNHDGEVNGKDLILLRQYLAGWNVVLGPDRQPV